MTINSTYIAIFWGSGLVMLSIFAGLATKKIGLPILLTYILVGILAGEEGPGGIHFENFEAAFLLGNLALSIIIFEGGLCTNKATFKNYMYPAISLSTLGVLITASITGTAVHFLLGLSWMEGMLIGAIVSSTDAAAVFGLLSTLNIKIRKNVIKTLEIESGINDPMAIFLTIMFMNLIIQSHQNDWITLIMNFSRQLFLGAAMGLLGGKLICYLLKKLSLTLPFYSLLTLSSAICFFGLTNIWGGSGFLAIYIIGTTVSNDKEMINLPSLRQFHEGIAWLCQIGMFLMLGLLVTPSDLKPIAFISLCIALIVIFIARPISVFISLALFDYKFNEKAFMSWVGLKGAVPIILAVFPLMAGIEHTTLYFEVAFFVVLISLLLQGCTVALSAKIFRVNDE